MNSKTLVIAVLLAAVAAATATETSTNFKYPRSKRSFSFLPSFLGGGSATAEQPEPVVEVVENKLSPLPQPLPYPDASVIGPIITQPKLINNELHYPIWRVHKYNGVHLQPLPVTVVQNKPGIQVSQVSANVLPVQIGGVDSSADGGFVTFEQPIQQFPSPVIPSVPSTPSSSSSSSTPTGSTSESSSSTTPPVENWLSPDLIASAALLGITDFSKLPSLQEAMDVLGTTSREETLDAVKEFAATAEGRELIRDFVNGQSTSDNEVAASEQEEVVQSPDGVETVETLETIEDANSAANPMQYFYNPVQGEIISKVTTVGNDAAKTEEQQEAEEAPEVETTTSPNVIGRITQWASFLNPFRNREVIPIPASKIEIKERVATVPLSVTDEHIINQNTVPLPELPELAALPSIPGAEHPPPPLPTIHIPTRYIGSTLPRVNGGVPRAGGPYVRIKLPLAGFNPTPQIAIDPKYLNYGRKQLVEQRVTNTPFLINAVDDVAPVQIQADPTVVVNQPAPIPVNPTAFLPPPPAAVVGQPAVLHQSAPGISLYQGPTVFKSPPPVVVAGVNGQPSSAFVGRSAVFPQSASASHLYQGPTFFKSPALVGQSIAAPIFPAQTGFPSLIDPRSARPLPMPAQAPFSELVYQPASGLQIPAVAVPKPFHSNVLAPAVTSAVNIGQLPLEAPTGIVNVLPARSSYGQTLIQAPFDYAVAASEIDEQKVPAIVDASPTVDAEVENKIDEPENLEVTKPEKVKEEVQEETAAPKINNEDADEVKGEEQSKMATSNDDEKVNNEPMLIFASESTTQAVAEPVPESVVEENSSSNVETNSKSIADSEPKELDSIEDDKVGVVDVETTTEQLSRYEKMRPKLKMDMKSSHIQRIAKNSYTTGKVYRADQKAIDMMPFTLRHRVESKTT